MKKIIVFVLLVIALSIPVIYSFGASNEVPQSNWKDSTSEIAVPIDIVGWIDGVDQATNTTTSPYLPYVADITYVDGTTVSTAIYLRHYNGVLVRARYDRLAVITTLPIIRAWGYRNSSWQALPDSGGSYDITFSSDATKDVGDVMYNWTVPLKVPSLGCFKVLFTISTAFATSYSTSTAIEITRY